MLTSSCVLSDENRLASNEFRLDVASAYVHRGMLMNGDGVMQGQMRTGLPLKDEGTLTLRTFFNVDLSNSTGSNGWLPPGHAGEPTELDLEVGYGRTEGKLTYNVGLISYVFPHGKEFLLTAGTFGGERGETKELFGTFSYDLDAVQPFARVFVDIDEVHGYYLNLGAAKAMEFSDVVDANVSVAVGIADDKHSEWTHGIDVGGLTDLRLEGAVTYPFDKFTTGRLGLGLTTILEDELSDWFDDIGVDDTTLWLSLGFQWNF